MNEQNVKDFVYYGAEKYSSIELLRQMVPFCYLYLTFLRGCKHCGKCICIWNRWNSSHIVLYVFYIHISLMVP